MKKNLFVRAAAAVLTMMTALILASSAFAGTSTEAGSARVSGDSYLLSELNELPPFKFDKHKKGIGYGSCPVYTAPSVDSYRCANGRASCDTNAKMDEAGFVNGWLMVRYETNNGSCRVGYIPPKYVKGFKSSMVPHFGYIPAVADELIYVSDNPMRHDDSFAFIEYGEQFHILSKYNYYQKDGLEWWYIECTVDGQTARGFIEYNGTQFHLGYN